MEEIIKLENLDTSFVNLSRLIRYLREREFSGRLHITLDQYEADVFLYPGATPSVWEIDRDTGRDAQGEGALDRLLVRAQEPGGLITIHKRSPESIDPTGESDEPVIEINEHANAAAPPIEPAPEVNWDRLLAATTSLIAAVERAVQTTGEDFAEQFHKAGLELGDDYPFIDPTLGDFEYKPSGLRLRKRPAVAVYVNSLAAGLRRVIDKVAGRGESTRFRERVAAELAIAARKQPDALAEFTPHLDQIAGTRVL